MYMTYDEPSSSAPVSIVAYDISNTEIGRLTVPDPSTDPVFVEFSNPDSGTFQNVFSVKFEDGFNSLIIDNMDVTVPDV